MNFKEYQDKAKQFATYPSALERDRVSHRYLFLGLIGEVGEATNLIKKVIRGDGPLSEEKLMSELGDVLWYLSLLHYKLESEVDVDKILEYIGWEFEAGEKYSTEITVSLWFFLFTYSSRLIHVSYYAGEPAETELWDCFHSLFFLAYCHGIRVEDIYEQNISKLTDRQKSGTIKGSGETIEERLANVFSE